MAAEWRVFDSWNARGGKVDSISEIIAFSLSRVFFSFVYPSAHGETTLGNMSRSGVCALRGVEYVYTRIVTRCPRYCNRPSTMLSRTTTDLSVRRHFRPDMTPVPRKTIRNVFSLFSPSFWQAVMAALSNSYVCCTDLVLSLRVKNPNVVNNTTFIFRFLNQ